VADIDVRRAHRLGLEGARGVADKLAADLGRKFGLRGDWKGNVLHFERPGVTGSLAVTARDLHLTVALGFLLKAMKGSIERAVLAELDELLPVVKPKTAPPRPKKGS
jgi:putative polyhydroxyalkanoate system protein